MLKYQNYLNENFIAGLNESSSLQPAYLMIQDEYLTFAQPLIKRYMKLVKNKKFKVYGWGDAPGIFTFSEFLPAEIARLKKQKYTSIANEEYVRENWLEGGNIIDEPTKAEIKERDEIMSIANQLFPNKMRKFFWDVKKLRKTNKSIVRDAIQDDIYLKLLQEGTLNWERLQAICDSVGVRIPKSLLKMKEHSQAGSYAKTRGVSYSQQMKEFTIQVKAGLDPHRSEMIDYSMRSYDAAAKRFFNTGLTYNEWMEKHGFSRKTDQHWQSTIQMMHEKPNGRRYEDAVLISKAAYTAKFREKSEEYANGVIADFTAKFADKLGIISKRLGLPKLNFLSTATSSGKIIATVRATFDSGLEIDCDTEVILAGGYNIQRLHQRYLFKFKKDGKKVNLEQIDKYLK